MQLDMACSVDTHGRSTHRNRGEVDWVEAGRRGEGMGGDEGGKNYS